MSPWRRERGPIHDKQSPHARFTTPAPSQVIHGSEIGISAEERDIQHFGFGLPHFLFPTKPLKVPPVSPHAAVLLSTSSNLTFLS